LRMRSAGALAWTPNRFDTSSGYRISRIAAPSRRGDPRQWLVFQPCSGRPRIQRRARHGFAPCSVSSNRTVARFSTSRGNRSSADLCRLLGRMRRRLSLRLDRSVRSLVVSRFQVHPITYACGREYASKISGANVRSRTSGKSPMAP